MYRGVVEGEGVVINGKQGDGNALHVERGAIAADEAARDGDAVGCASLRQAMIDAVAFGERHTTEVIHHGDNAVARLQRGFGDGFFVPAGGVTIPLAQGAAVSAMFDEGAEHLADHGVEVGVRPAFDAGFAVDADAVFDFVVSEGKGGFARCRHGAGTEGDTDAVAVVVEFAAEGGEAVEVVAPAGGGAEQFFDEDGAGDATASGGVEAVFDGHIVIGEDDGDGVPHVVQEFGGGFEVQDVAGVVFDDEQHAAPAVHRFGAGEDLIRRGRGEDFARHGAVEHAVADVAAVHGFVAAAAAADEANFADNRRVCAGDVSGVTVQGEAGVGSDEALQLFVEDGVHTVNEFFHGCSWGWGLRVSTVPSGALVSMPESSGRAAWRQRMALWLWLSSSSRMTATQLSGRTAAALG